MGKIKIFDLNSNSSAVSLNSASFLYSLTDTEMYETSGGARKNTGSAILLGGLIGLAAGAGLAQHLAER